MTETPIRLEPYAKVLAVFRPKKTDDLRKNGIEMIGWVGTWQVNWIIESGPYQGQWALQPLGELAAKALAGDPDDAFAWVPECDLDIMEVIPVACDVNPFSSRMCTDGTKGCIVQHEEAT